MEVIKHKVIYWFFIHVLLRRIGKRYPDFFESWVGDYVSKPRDRKILILRYTGKDRMSFTAIAARHFNKCLLHNSGCVGKCSTGGGYNYRR